MVKKNDEELTTNFGAPVDGDLFTVTGGEHGPILIQDTHLTEKLGNYDMVGDNTPIFFTCDPLKFPDFMFIAARCIRSDNERRTPHE